jgi:hypothetical protein
MSGLVWSTKDMSVQLGDLGILATLCSKIGRWWAGVGPLGTQDIIKETFIKGKEH